MVWFSWYSVREMPAPAWKSAGSVRTSGTSAERAASNGALNSSANSSIAVSDHSGASAATISASTATTAARARSQPIISARRGSRSARGPSSSAPAMPGR